MEERESNDIAKTKMELADLSVNEQSAFCLTLPTEEDSQQPIHGPKGFCVKEHEEQMQALTKENFNLKLRIYFLEEKNHNVPEGAETIYKENIDLKIDNENLMRDLQEKQDLLLQASKAMDLLDAQKSDELDRSQMVVDELNQKIESLEHEVLSLQNALAEANNKSVFANDTGYADFIGAVDSKEIECQRKMFELNEIEKQWRQQMNIANEKLEELKVQKEDIEKKASNLLYENDEMKDKLSNIEKNMIDQKPKLELELREFKEKWASASCDLQDTEQKLRETEAERQKTLVILESTLTALEAERKKINEWENKVAESYVSASSKNSSKNEFLVSNEQKLLAMKNNEIEKLNDELFHAKRQIQKMTGNELNDKNREIEKLNNLVKSLQDDRNCQMSFHASRMSTEQLSESFNDLKFQQAMEEKKRSQRKIDELMNELVDVANSKTKEHVTQLQRQMAIVVEKQEVTDTALGKCVEICACTFDHLHHLEQFLKALLQQKDIRESLSEMTLFNIQSVLDKTFEYTSQAGRFSTDGRLSSFPDISSLDILMTTARNSIANIREIQSCNKSIQASDEEEKEAMRVEVETMKKEMEDMNRVNQLLEDEICQLKQMMQDHKLKLSTYDEEIQELKTTKNLLNSKLQDYQNQAETLTSTCDKLEETLQAETVKKIGFESRAVTSETLASKLQEKLESISKDLEVNWVTKDEHDEKIRRLEEDIVNGEAQVAAIRMEMDTIRENFIETNASVATPICEKLEKLSLEDGKENAKALVENFDFSSQATSRRTLEISEDRKRLLCSNGDLDNFAVSSTTDSNCLMCPKYQAKIAELKKYLSRAIDKIKFQSEIKLQNERQIQKQLSDTENFLNQARSNMNNVLKTRNTNQD